VIKSSIQKAQWLSSSIGVELAIEMDGTVVCRMCSLTLEKNSLTIGEKKGYRGSLDEALASIPNSTPIAVSLTGKGVLTKRIDGVGELNAQRLSEVFPNFKSESFYVQQFAGDENVFVSIVRKEQVESLLESLNLSQHKVLCMTLGPFAVSQVLSQINTYGQELCFSGHRINYTEGFKWRDYKSSPEAMSEFPIKIEQEKLGEEYLIAYATAFQLILYPRLNTIELPVTEMSDRLEDFTQKQKFRFRLVAILGFLFVLLLVNFFVFSAYRAENELLYTRVNLQSSSAENLQMLEKKTIQEQERLKMLGWYRGLPYSWLADQVSSDMPAAVELTELSVSPVIQAEGNTERKEIYQSGKISIKGFTGDPIAVNDWIYKLKERAWVQQVQMQRFSPAEEKGIQEFEMSLTY